MALADDLRLLSIQSLTALDASHDYYTFSKRLWRVLPPLIKEGRKYGFRNRTTGTSVDEVALLERAQLYVKDYLAPSTFQHFVSLFEDYVFGLLRCWLAEYPGSLARKQIDVGAVLRAGDTKAVLLEVVDKELNELKYERLSDWFAYLARLVNLGCPSPYEIEQLTEIKASRDILVHGNGIANVVYVMKAGKLARRRAGEKLKVPEPYHRASWELIRKVIQDLSAAAQGKLRVT